MFLATTGAEAFWDVTKPLLFLGEWCKQQSKKDVWEKLNITVLDSSSICASSLQSYYYSIEKYEKLLPTLGCWFNKIHHVNYSMNYWRIIFGPFLLWYIQSMHHRLTYLKLAYSIYPDLETIGLSKASFLTPCDTGEFYALTSDSDSWNLQLFTQILLESGLCAKLLYRKYDWKNELEQRKKRITRSQYKLVTRTKLKLMQFFINVFPYRKILLNDNAAIGNKHRLKLFFLSKFKILPLITSIGNDMENLYQNISLDHDLRTQIKSLSVDDEFSQLILKTLVINTPLNFIEKYYSYAKFSNKIYPYKPKVVISVDWAGNDFIKFWGAKIAEKGTKVIGLQHGGGYGMVKFCSLEYLERDNTHHFISWGWKEDDTILPLPSLSSASLFERYQPKLKKESQTIIFWPVSEPISRYLVFYGSYVNDNYNSYFEWQQRFSIALSPKIRHQLLLRLRPNSKYFQLTKTYLPEINIFRPTTRDSFFEQLCEAKIVVSDNLHTTVLYALYCNIPTILFCCNDFWAVRPQAEVFIQLLREAKIYHDTPESAALFLNEIEKDINVWWSSKQVQLARNNFLQYFAKTDQNWCKTWANTLLKALD